LAAGPTNPRRHLGIVVEDGYGPERCRRMSRGHDRERAVGDLLEDWGWVVVRAAGSFGVADLVACVDGFAHHPLWPADSPHHYDRLTMFVEVKSTAGGPYERFGPVERLRLFQAAAKAGAEPLLAWWPPGRGRRCEWIGSHEWPRLKPV
jgi:Holliday junction resolvase